MFGSGHGGGGQLGHQGAKNSNVELSYQNTDYSRSRKFSIASSIVLPCVSFDSVFKGSVLKLQVHMQKVF